MHIFTFLGTELIRIRNRILKRMRLGLSHFDLLSMIFFLEDLYCMLWNFHHCYTILCLIASQNWVLFSKCKMANVECCRTMSSTPVLALPSFSPFCDRIALNVAEMGKSSVRSNLCYHPGYSCVLGPPGCPHLTHIYTLSRGLCLFSCTGCSTRNLVHLQTRLGQLPLRGFGGSIMLCW